MLDLLVSKYAKVPLRTVKKEGAFNLLTSRSLVLPEAQKKALTELRNLIQGFNEVQFIAEKRLLSSSTVAGIYARRLLKGEKIEKLYAICLNGQNEVVASKCVSEGTVNQSSVYIREIVKYALDVEASSVIMTHNHPSGSDKPSPQDVAVTKRIKAGLETVDIRLNDHIICFDHGHTSMAERGMV